VKPWNSFLLTQCETLTYFILYVWMDENEVTSIYSQGEQEIEQARAYNI